MTLTELRYIVAVARERHFGRAAQACFVSQPTLSVAIKKIEEEFDVKIFERGTNDVSLTPIGLRIVDQAKIVLEQAASVKEIAKQGRDPLAGPLRVGVIYTIGPYLLPKLVRRLIDTVPQMPLLLQENFTVKLLELLKRGEIDCAIMALPLPESGLSMQALYDEDFIVAVPRAHAWAQREHIHSKELAEQTMLLLGAGHCLRDQVIGVCPELAKFSSQSQGMQKSFEGSSLETIRHMVASGIGITVLPTTAVAPSGQGASDLLKFVPFNQPAPDRRVVLAWRKSFPRDQAIAALRDAVLSCGLSDVRLLTDAQLETF